MDGLLIFLTVFVTLVCSVCTALLTPFRQLRLRVEQRFFKTVRFKGVSVIVPMFVLFIVGLLLTVLIWVLVPLLYYRAGIDLDVLVVVPVAVAVPYAIAVVLTEFICVYISRNRQAEVSVEQEQLTDEQTPDEE